MLPQQVNVIGGGLAGSEIAFQLSRLGIPVNLYEMRKSGQKTFAHRSNKFAELVCSNSFRADDPSSAIGLLHEEMRVCNSLIMQMADKNKVPAGGALAVDRESFADDIENVLMSARNINIISDEVKSLSELGNEAYTIIATGPLTSENLVSDILQFTSEQGLSFFDAIAPIVYKDSVNMDIAWYQSRYDKNVTDNQQGDYINCPLSKEQYYELVDDLVKADKVDFKNWEKDTPYFEACLPIEVMAVRGKDTLAFGPLKPVGLVNPHHDVKPFAVVQLRQDNHAGTLYNMVGFQTKMTYKEQMRILRKIPALENAVFARLGGVHRNIFINSPILLDVDLSLKTNNKIIFAGQIIGVEGYVESAASGLVSALLLALRYYNNNVVLPPIDSAMGSLLNYVTQGHLSGNNKTFQPMNINFGLLPNKHKEIRDKKKRRKLVCQDAINSIKSWYQNVSDELGVSA